VGSLVGSVLGVERREIGSSTAFTPSSEVGFSAFGANGGVDVGWDGPDGSVVDCPRPFVQKRDIVSLAY
jgi:hypothetical protein